MAENTSILKLTTQIIGAYVGHNSVDVADLPGLIRSVHAALANAGSPPAPADGETEKPVPAVSIRKSVTADAIICLVCGYKGKMLKRHLQIAHDLTPEQYRQRFGLPADYPMVTPIYAAARSEMAKTIGLGTRRRPKAT